MLRFRFRVLFLLLVLILLLASLVFGLLTYWLGAEGPSSKPVGGGQGRAPLLYLAELLVPGERSAPGQVDGCFLLDPFVEERRGYW